MRTFLRHIILLVSCFLLSIASTWGQFDRGVMPSNVNIPDSAFNAQNPSLPDTLVLKYFKLVDISTYYDYADSTLDNFFHHYEPSKQREIDYLTTGNAGSAARSMQFKTKERIGYTSGLDQYNLYNLQLQDFKFFENNVPFSDVLFTPVSSQENFVVKSDFAREFDGGTSLSLNYDRIRQLGFYTNQLTKMTNFGASLRYKSDNDRYTAFISMISNVNEEGNNGGVTTDTLFNTALYQERSNYPIFLSDAQTRHQQKHYALTNYYQLSDPAKEGTNLLLRYDLSYDTRYQKFTDDDVSADQDSIFYGDFLKEERGIRFYNRENNVSNAFYAYATDGKRLNIRAGIEYDRISIDQQGISSSFDNVILDFNGDVPIGKSLNISTVGKLGLLDAGGDFFAKGSLDYRLGKWVDFSGGASVYRRTPSLISRNLVLNGQEIWNNDFTKPVGTDIFGSFSIPKANFTAKIQQSVVNNLIYFDSTAAPQQLADVFSATTIQLSHKVKFWKMGLENYMLFQLFSENAYNLPPFYSKHNLYIQGRLFDNVLESRLGAEIRLTPSYEGAAYNPVIGQFYEQSESIDFYPMTDVYFTGKVQKFRIFFKFENVVGFFNSDVTYQTLYHPQFDGKFRFGVSWLLLN